VKGILVLALVFMSCAAFSQDDPKAAIDALIAKANAEQKRINAVGKSVEDIGDPAWIQQATRDRDKYYQQAIKLSLAYAGIVPTELSGKPIMPDGIAQAREKKGEKISWTPVYKTDEPRSYLGNKTILHHLASRESIEDVPSLQEITPFLVKNGGLTAADGITTIVGEFADADDLIFTLVHEKIHFDQFTDPRLANLPFYQREAKAWDATVLKLANRISPAKLAYYQGRAIKNARDYRAGGVPVAGGAWGKSAEPAVFVHTTEELERIKRHAMMLEEDMRKDVERLDQLVLMALAEAACVDLASVDPEFIRRANPPDASIYSDAQIATYNSAPCRDQLFSGMLRRRLDGKFISQDWLQASLNGIAQNRPAPVAQLSEQTETPRAELSLAPKVPIHAAFDLARLARMACAGKPLGDAVSDIAVWFPEEYLAFKDAPLADLDGCERQVYLALLDAKALTPEFVAGLVPQTASEVGGGGPGSTPHRGADLSHPIRVIPLIKPSF
jgi:hypothetical protein